MRFSVALLSCHTKSHYLLRQTGWFDLNQPLIRYSRFGQKLANVYTRKSAGALGGEHRRLK
jgi:hypothetical protein